MPKFAVNVELRTEGADIALAGETARAFSAKVLNPTLQDLSRGGLESMDLFRD